MIDKILLKIERNRPCAQGKSEHTARLQPSGESLTMSQSP